MEHERNFLSDRFSELIYKTSPRSSERTEIHSPVAFLNKETQYRSEKNAKNRYESFSLEKWLYEFLHKTLFNKMLEIYLSILAWHLPTWRRIPLIGLTSGVEQQSYWNHTPQKLLLQIHDRSKNICRLYGRFFESNVPISITNLDRTKSFTIRQYIWYSKTKLFRWSHRYTFHSSALDPWRLSK